MRHHILVFATACTLAACGDVSSQSDFATDSFVSPTAHGDLSFEKESLARFTSSERFHAWTFELSGNAEVVLEANPQESNLDTVAYLYAADADGKKTGSYLAKNDDVDGKLASRIAESLPAGHYLLMVKAGKELMRGNFEVAGSCSGAGCPVIEAPGPELFCEGAYESIGKCMDDSLDATEEECAPDASSSEAVLCCNLVPDESFCSSVCDGSAPQLARNWGSDTDPLWSVFPEDDYSGLMDAHDFAVATCSSPTLDSLQQLILATDDLEHDDPWNVEGWVVAGSDEFTSWTINQEVIDAATAIVGEQPAARFHADVEIPCPNCTDGYAKAALWFENAGRLLVLDSRWGYDS